MSRVPHRSSFLSSIFEATEWSVEQWPEMIHHTINLIDHRLGPFEKQADGEGIVFYDNPHMKGTPNYIQISFVIEKEIVGGGVRGEVRVMARRGGETQVESYKSRWDIGNWKRAPYDLVKAAFRLIDRLPPPRGGGGGEGPKLGPTMPSLKRINPKFRKLRKLRMD